MSADFVLEQITSCTIFELVYTSITFGVVGNQDRFVRWLNDSILVVAVYLVSDKVCSVGCLILSKTNDLLNGSKIPNTGILLFAAAVIN